MSEARRHILNKVLKPRELEQTFFEGDALTSFIEEAKNQVFEDELDEVLETLTKRLLDLNRLAEAEAVALRISDDWASIAVELLAEIASKLWAGGQKENAYNVWAQALRQSNGCDEWKWVEAESLAKVAGAAMVMGLPDLFLAVINEALRVAREDIERGGIQNSLDACGVTRQIAVRLAQEGYRDRAIEAAERIPIPTRRERALREIHELERSQLNWHGSRRNQPVQGRCYTTRGG